MPAGDIRSRRTDVPTAELRLPVGFGGLKPLFDYLMDTAAETLKVTEEYRDAQRETNEILRRIEGKLGRTDGAPPE